MQTPFAKMLTVALAAVLALVALDTASARTKKHRVHSGPEAAFWGDLVPTENGVPIIMKGYHPPAPPKEDGVQQRADRPVKIPRGSSSFVDIPPVNPSPNSPNSPPAAALTRPAPEPYKPPPINTFGDRVTNCIHSFPLQGGLGNNPTDQQSYIRQCAN